MSVEENVQLIRRWFQEVWNEGKIQTVRELMAADAVANGQSERGETIRGPEEFAVFVERTRGAFPDIRIKVEDVFGAGDKVALRWSGVMTHSGDQLGIPASGKILHLTGVTIAQFREGKIIAGWDNWDQLGMMRQIGALEPSPIGMRRSA